MKTKSTPSPAINNERFQIKDAPGASGKVVSAYPTREAADEALLTMRKEDSVQSASYIIADLGIPDPKSPNEAVEAAKTAEQKETERLAKDKSAESQPRP